MSWPEHERAVTYTQISKIKSTRSGYYPTHCFNLADSGRTRSIGLLTLAGKPLSLIRIAI